MKHVFRFLLTLLLVQAMIVLGSLVGGLLRTLLTGKPMQGGIFKYTDERGQTYTSFPPLTHSLAGITGSLLTLRKPYLGGFAGGFLAAVLVGEELEIRLMKDFLARITPH